MNVEEFLALLRALPQQTGAVNQAGQAANAAMQGVEPPPLRTAQFAQPGLMPGGSSPQNMPQSPYEALAGWSSQGAPPPLPTQQPMQPSPEAYSVYRMLGGR